MGLESVHLRELVEGIGPRPAATDAEARAADYLETVFIARGLEVDRQEFTTPRTASWAFVLYHLLTIASGAAVGVKMLRWPAFVLALATAVVMWLDLDTRWGLSRVITKGPSQNVVARHVPKARRGERVRRVVVVAHYDSARASLASSPSLAKHAGLMSALTRAVTFGMPLVILASVLPFPAAALKWVWYATMAFSAYLLVPLFIALHSEVLLRFTDGAGDNASGVAAMLGVMDRIVPEAESFDRPEAQPQRRGADEIWAADVMPMGATLSYAPSETPVERERVREYSPDDDWGDIDGPASLPGAPAGGSAAADLSATASFTAPLDAASADVPDASAYATAEPAVPAAAPEGTGGKDRGIADWLGLGRGFDARKRGREIGSWDNFGEESDEEDDGIGWKGGSAPLDDVDSPEFAAAEAARIRRLVTERADRDLVEKEVWFVATGAHEPGAFGMRAFLAANREDVADAVIINLDNVGSGKVHYVTSEGVVRRYHSDRRLGSIAKRVVREDELDVQPAAYRTAVTDATAALARGFRAMSVMAFDINGRVPNRHWRTDTAETCSEGTIDAAADFVTKLIREL